MQIVLLSLLFASALLTSAAELKITVLSDLHVSPGNANDKLMPQLVAEINASDTDLVVVTGDLTNHGSDAELKCVHKRLSGIRKPLYAVSGNHETNWSESAGQTFAELWGRERFAVKHKGVVLIGFPTGPYLKMGDGYVRSEDVAFLKESLKRLAGAGEPVIVFCHYPLAGELGNGPMIAKILREYHILGVVSGHTHVQFRQRIYGLDSIVCRPLVDWDKTCGYDLLQTDGKTLEAFEKRLGGEILPFKQRDPIEEKPFPQEAPLPDHVEVTLLHADPASVFTGAAVTENGLYYGTSDGRFVALDPESGKVLWEKQLGSPLHSTPAAYDGTVAIGTTSAPDGQEGGGGIAFFSERARKLLHWQPAPSPVIGGGCATESELYIGGGSHSFYRVDANGSCLKASGEEFGPMQGRPAVGEGVVVFGAWDTNLYALDAETLELRWKWNNGNSQVLYSPGNVNPVISRGQAIIVAPDRFMSAIDLKTGKTVWRSNAYKVRESLGGSEDGSTVYAKTMDGELIAVETGRPEFTLKWVCDLKFGYDHAPCPVLESDGIVYAGSRNGVIAAVDADSGTLLWKFRGGDSAVNDFTRGPDGAVYATLIEGRIYRIRD